ncbi:MAG: DUF3987 domain-containing protein, partial [Thermoleophilia bacterium]|nr:DUF3987 domain-containing protein [Thermoleophilia bacterium]
DAVIEEPPPVLPPQPEVKPFPLEALPAGLVDFVREAAQAQGCPPEFIAVPALTILGAAIGSRYVLEIKKDWRFQANLYSCVVAEPGAGKSPAKLLADRPIRELQHALAEDYVLAMEIYEQEMAAWETEVAEARKNGRPRPRKPEEPRMIEVFTTDTTVEALAETLRWNPHGMLLLLDELSGWVNGLNQYKRGRGSDREFYLSVWNGTVVKVNRKGRPPIILERPFVAATGCMVPSALRTLTAEYGEDGFIHRILFAYPDFVVPSWPKAAISAEAWETYRKIFRRLWDLPATPDNPVVLELTPAAYALWVEMYDGLVAERSQPDFQEHLHGPWAKMPSQAARLALIIHLCELVAARLDIEEPPELGPVDEFSMAKAWLLVDYFKSHARRVYSELRESP